MLFSRAGAQWRSHETSYTEAASWDAETYKEWMELVKKEKDCGVAVSLYPLLSVR